MAHNILENFVNEIVELIREKLYCMAIKDSSLNTNDDKPEASNSFLNIGITKYKEKNCNDLAQKRIANCKTEFSEKVKKG